MYQEKVSTQRAIFIILCFNNSSFDVQRVAISQTDAAQFLMIQQSKCANRLCPADLSLPGEILTNSNLRLAFRCLFN